MSLNLTGKNIDITPALKAHAEAKFEKISERFPQASNIHVILHIDHLDHTAEATLHFNSHEVFASASAKDMYAAIDAMAEKISTQLQKHKEKVIDSHQS